MLNWKRNDALAGLMAFSDDGDCYTIYEDQYGYQLRANGVIVKNNCPNADECKSHAEQMEGKKPPVKQQEDKPEVNDEMSMTTQEKNNKRKQS